MEISEPKVAGEGISVHLVLYIKRAAQRTDIYDILMKLDEVMSVDFL